MILSDVGAAIVNTNAGDRLRACITSLAEEGIREIVVVDNRSTDDSIQTVSAAFPNVPVITLPHQLGFGPAMNRAVNELTNQFVMCLDANAVIGQGALDALVQAIARDSRVAACGPQLENSHSVSGAAMLVRRDHFVAIGGYAERSFMYVEDDDLSRRLRRAGHRLVVEPNVAIHVEGRLERPSMRRILAHHRSLFQYYRSTTRGFGRAALPFVALGLIVRLPVACFHQFRQARTAGTRRVDLDQPAQTRQRR